MKIGHALFIMLLLFGCLVSIAVADDNNFSTDTIYSDSKVLGFEKKNTDPFSDLSMKNVESVMTSLPTWALMALAILLLAGLTIIGIALSILWNMVKMSNAARKENTQEAVREIHGHKKNNRELIKAAAEGGFFLIVLVFVIGLMR